MNERIRELADQAELTIHTSTGTYMSHPEFNKKFAELIVRECADVLLEWKKEPFPLDPDFAASLIKEHFGVEK
jgi:hypothetical protein